MLELQTQAARDLEWALSSPSLMRHPCAVGEEFGELEVARNQGLLSQLDRKGSQLHRAIENRQTDRLGEYFEILINTWIAMVPPARLIAANQQVHKGEHTVGEFDLLFERDRVVHHWELAVKYYLGHPGPRGQSLWYGPNPKDRLDKKWPKMLRRQLRLAEKPAAQKTLQKLGIDGKVEPSAFIKGYFFEPLDDAFAVADHEDANPTGFRGWWVHHSDLADYYDAIDPDNELVWMRLSRLRWMAPARPDERDKLHATERLQDVLSASRHTQVAGVLETDVGWREISRGFVVPDRWPTRR
ncbi:MAG: DUF1853 family protein [Persicimonas sp.]